MPVSDLIVAPARIWIAPAGESLPDETTIALGAVWGGNWADMGYTIEPVSISYETETIALEVQQLLSPARRFRTAEACAIETTLAEFTGANLVVALGATKTTTAAGASQAGFDHIEAGGATTMTEYTFGIEGKRVLSTGVELPIRVFVYRAVATLGGELSFAKGDPTGIPLRLDVLPDTTKAAGKQLIVIDSVTAAKTS